MSTRLRWATVGAVLARLLAAAALVFGPWTDEPAELEGWDVERFQEIADTAGAPYVDHEVEYPPFTVVVAEEVLADDVVTSHQRLVVLSLFIDLGLAAALTRYWSTRAAATYLLLSLPMVPSGLLRLDLWAGLAAVAAAATIAPLRSHPSQHAGIERHRDSLAVGAFALFTVTGAMIKLWPALLIAGAIGVRKFRFAAAATAIGAAAGALWLAISGVAAIEQITSLRGVTGWHLESIPGSLVALFGSDSPRLEADAFRIGQLNDAAVLAGRVAAIAVIGAAAGLAARSRRQPSERLALVMLVSVAALIITAPLLSPQFLLWLTPWAAIAHRQRTLLLLTAGTTVLTAGVLAAFGPPDLDHRLAAIVLLVRDGLLIAMIAVGLRVLAASDWFEFSSPNR